MGLTFSCHSALLEAQKEVPNIQSLNVLEAHWNIYSAQPLRLAGGIVGCTFCSVVALTCYRHSGIYNLTPSYWRLRGMILMLIHSTLLYSQWEVPSQSLLLAVRSTFCLVFQPFWRHSGRYLLLSKTARISVGGTFCSLVQTCWRISGRYLLLSHSTLL